MKCILLWSGGMLDAQRAEHVPLCPFKLLEKISLAQIRQSPLRLGSLQTKHGNRILSYDVLPVLCLDS